MKLARAENNMTLTASSLVNVSSCEKKWTTNVESQGLELDFQPMINQLQPFKSDAEIEELEAQLEEEILAFHNWKKPALLSRYQESKMNLTFISIRYSGNLCGEVIQRIFSFIGITH